MVPPSRYHSLPQTLILLLGCSSPQNPAPIGETTSELGTCPLGQQLGYNPPRVECVSIGEKSEDEPCNHPGDCLEGLACSPQISHSDIVSPDRFIIGPRVCRTIANQGSCPPDFSYQTLLRSDSPPFFDQILLFSLGDPVFPVTYPDGRGFGVCLRHCNMDCLEPLLYCGKDVSSDPEPNTCRRRSP